MSLLKERDEILANAIAILKYGKSLDEIVEEFQAIKAKTEQLLAQQRTKTEQLLAQQRTKTENTIVNMHQKLAIDVATIANILNVPTDFVQEVLSKKGLV